MTILGTHNTTSSLAPGQTLSSDLSSNSDIDWIALEDLSYPYDDNIIRIESDADLSGAEIALYQELYSSSGRYFEQIAIISVNPDGTIPDFAARFGYSYYVALTGFTGDYDVTALSDAERQTLMDGLPADAPGEGGSVLVGESVSGVLQNRLDVDSFTVELTGGHTYDFNVTDGLGLNPSDPNGAFVISDASGSNVLWEYGETGSTEFVVDDSGTYTVTVSLTEANSSYGMPVSEDYSDTYAFSLSDLGTASLPGGNDAGSAVQLGLGVAHNVTLGERGSVADGGWFAFSGQADAQYRVTVTGTFARVSISDDGYSNDYYASSTVTEDGASIAQDYTAVLSADELVAFHVYSWEETDDVSILIEDVAVPDDSAPVSLTLDETITGIARHAGPDTPIASYNLEVVEGELYTITVDSGQNEEHLRPPTMDISYSNTVDVVMWDSTYSRTSGVSVLQFVAMETGTVALDLQRDDTGVGYTTNIDRRLPTTDYVGPVDISVTTSIADDRAGPYSGLVSPLDTDVVTAGMANFDQDRDSYVFLIEEGRSYTFLASIDGYVSVHRTDATPETGWDPYYGPATSWVGTPLPYEYGATFEEQLQSYRADNMLLERESDGLTTTATFVADYSGYVLLSLGGMPETTNYQVLLTEGEATPAQLAALGIATSGDDTLNGTEGADTIDGLAGRDVISGGNGADSLVGGEGDDVLRGDDDDDTLNGGEDDDLLAGNAGSDVLRGGDGDDRLFGGSGQDVLAGNSGRDVLDGGASDDLIFGGNDDDSILGGAGADIARGGNGNDRVEGQDGNDVVVGNNGNDTVLGGEGDDTGFGGAGMDILSGGSGNDSLLAGIDNDTLYGNAGLDFLNGEDGADYVSGGNGNDTLYGRDGADTLRGGNDNDLISAGADSDFVAGNAGDDTLFGGAGNDRLFGGGENDRLSGGVGSDTLSGGVGADVFVFSNASESPHGAGRDVIVDFEVGVDHIDLTGLGGSLRFVSAYTGTAGEVRYNESIGRLYVDLDGDMASDLSIDVQDGPELTAADLIL